MSKLAAFFMRIIKWIIKLTPFRISLAIMIGFLYLFIQKEIEMPLIELDSPDAKFKFLELIELKAYDIRFQILNRLIRPPISDKIVIVEIDDRAADYLGWPFPRSEWAKFVRRMNEYGAQVIGFDVVFETEAEYVGLKFLRDSIMQYEAMGLNEFPRELEGSKDSDLLEYKNNVSKFGEYLRQKEKIADTDLAFAQALGDVKEDMKVVLGWYGWSNAAEIAALDDQDFSDEAELLETSKLSYQFSKSWSMEKVLRFFWRVKVLGLQTNVPILSENTDHFGFFTTKVDAIDGTIRKTPLINIFSSDPENPTSDNFFIYPSLSLAAISAWYDEKPMVNVKGDFGAIVTIKGKEIPTDQYGRLLINWMGEFRTFPYYSIYDVLTDFRDQDPTQEQIKDPRKLFKGKIVLIGSTTIGAHDMRTTPFGTAAGVEMHANVISNILRGEALVKPEWFKAFDMLFIIVVALLFGLILPRLSAIYGGIVTLAMFLGYMGFNVYLFLNYYYSFTIVFPLAELALIYFGITIYRYATEEREKRYIKKAFEFYLSPHVIKALMDDPSKLKLGGERRVCTAFFSDIQSFSSFSEKMDPESLVHFLNEYLTEMCDIILEYDGTIDKFEGDAIIAFFGAPLDLPDHAARACKVAARIQARMVVLREKWAEEGMPEVYMRIGLNTGPMVVGNMGSAYRMDYTMMGDAVNLAARLEEGAKKFRMYTLISSDTYDGAKDIVEVRDLHLFQVVGKEKAVHVYEIVGEKGKADPEIMKVVDLFHRGLELYKQQKFAEAKAIFENAVELNEKDGPSLTFIDLCEKHIKTPPGDGWDAVYVWGSKDE